MPIHPRSLLFVLPLTLGWVNELFAQPADPTTYLPLQTTSGRNAAGATASKQTDFGIELGEEEYVLGPGPIPLDNPMFSVRNGSTAFIYSANGTTLVYVQPQIYPLTAAPKSALGPGPAGSFDDCGAWLQSVSFPRAGGAVGWYHAETNCNYALGITQKSMAYAESSDGITWTKPNYPGNQILTPPAAVANDPARNSVGDGHVLQSGSYNYLFYWANDPFGVHLTRSAITDNGRPGTWSKYYNGFFSQPGLGGQSVPVSTQLLSTFVVYNTYLARFIAMPVFGRWGFAVNYSTGSDLLTWSSFPRSGSIKTIYPPVSYSEDGTVDNGYNRSATDRQYYNYPSLIAPDGNSNSLGQIFYLYYMKLFPGEDFSQRYQMRRKVTVMLSPPTNYVARIALSQYKDQAGHAKISTEIAKPREGYAFIERMGYLLPYEEAGFKSIYECFSPQAQSYFLSTADPAIWNWGHCESMGDIFVRRVGYIAATPGPEMDLALYRCTDATGALYESTDPACGGQRFEQGLGYLFSKGFSDVSASGPKIK